MEKGPDAFRTISEVADDLDLPQHVLRFWETRFAQIKPMKRGGGRRYYRPDDVDLLRGIRHLLYGEGYTIRGVQQILKDQGLRYVQTVGRSAETDPQRLREINFDQEALEADAEQESLNVGVGGGRGVVSFSAPPRPASSRKCRARMSRVWSKCRRRSRSNSMTKVRPFRFGNLRRRRTAKSRGSRCAPLPRSALRVSRAYPNRSYVLHHLAHR